MGIEINYQLRSNVTTAQAAYDLVDALRFRACDLPFVEVGQIVEFQDAEANWENHAPDDPDFWLLLQACCWLSGADECHLVAPRRIIAFGTMPGPGSEPANFGLCQYPPGIEEVAWRWSSFCGTQNEDLVDDAFLRNHLTVISLLDGARELGILAGVLDEGGYWDSRSLKTLTRQSLTFPGPILADAAEAFRSRKSQARQIIAFPDFAKLQSEFPFDHHDNR